MIFSEPLTMKTILFFTVICLSCFSSIKATNILTELTIIKTAEVEVSLLHISQKKFFKTAEYNLKSNSLDFITAEKIHYIRIYTQQGELKYQLPVLSNKVRISKKLFKRGEYRLGFVVEGQKVIEFTNVKIN